MKKVLLALIVIGAIAAGVYMKFGTGVSLKPEQIISEDVTLFMDMQDLEGELEYFNQTKMGKVFNNINYKKLMTELKATPKDIKEVEDAIADIKEYMPVVKQLLGEQVAVAFDSSAIKDTDFSNEKKAPQEALSGLTIILKPKMGAAALNLIMSNIPNDDVIATEEYKGRTIVTVEEDADDVKIKGFYTISNELLICTFSLDKAKECIDNADNAKAATLANSAEFKELSSKFKTGYKSFGYIKLGQFYKDIMGAIAKQTKDLSGMAKAQLDSQLAIANSVYGSYDTIAGAGYREGNVSTSSVITTLNKGDISPMVKCQLGSPQDIVASANYATDETSVHVVSSFNFAEYVKFLEDATKLPPQQSQMAKGQFKAMTNTSLDEFLKAFGSSIGFNLETVNTKGPFPIPNLTLFFKLESRKTIEGAINNLMAKGVVPVPLEDEKYGETSIKSVTTRFATPSIGFHNDMMFISSSKDYLKAMVDAQKNNKTLAGTADFKKYTQQSQAISHVYIQGEQLSSALKSAVSFSKMSPKMKSSESTYVIDSVVSPLVDSLSMYKLISQTTFKEGDDIKVESTAVIQ